MASSAVTVGGTVTTSLVIRPPAESSSYGQQLADVVGLVGLHAAQQVLSALGLEVAEDVGGVVWLHLFEDVGGALGLHAPNQRQLQVGADLAERVGGRFVVEGVEHFVDVVLVELRDDLGDIRGVQLGQVFVRHLELDAGRARLDRLDGFPGDRLGRQPHAERAEHAPRAQATQQAGGRDVDADQAVAAVGRRELQVVDAHDAHAVDVDDLVVEHLARQRQLVRRRVERRRHRPARSAGSGRRRRASRTADHGTVARSPLDGLRDSASTAG